MTFETGHIARYVAPRGKGVIVITGHSDKALATFVNELGEKGYFRDNFVLFNSCETKLTHQMLTKINSEYGAIASYGHEGVISASKVQQSMVELADALQQPHPKGFSFIKIIDDAFHRNGLNGIWTICALEETRFGGLDA